MSENLGLEFEVEQVYVGESLFDNRYKIIVTQGELSASIEGTFREMSDLHRQLHQLLFGYRMGEEPVGKLPARKATDIDWGAPLGWNQYEKNADKAMDKPHDPKEE